MKKEPNHDDNKSQDPRRQDDSDSPAIGEHRTHCQPTLLGSGGVLEKLGGREAGGDVPEGSRGGAGPCSDGGGPDGVLGRSTKAGTDGGATGFGLSAEAVRGGLGGGGGGGKSVFSLGRRGPEPSGFLDDGRVEKDPVGDGRACGQAPGRAGGGGPVGRRAVPGEVGGLKSKQSGWIGVDLDGTLAEYDGYQGAGHIGEPIPEMVERVREWLAEGRDVRILTARVSSEQTDEDREEAKLAIEDWCFRVFGRVLPVQSEKDHFMSALWDDRAVQVESNTGRVLGEPGLIKGEQAGHEFHGNQWTNGGEEEDKDAEWSESKRAIENTSRNVSDFLVANGFRVENEYRAIGGSTYFDVIHKDPDFTENGIEYEGYEHQAEVRVSDHIAPKGSGFNEGTQEQHDEPHINVIVDGSTEAYKAAPLVRDAMSDYVKYEKDDTTGEPFRVLIDLRGKNKSFVGTKGENKPDHSKQAASIIRQAFKPREWRDKIVNAVLPVLAVGMAKAVAGQFLAMGVDIRRKGRKPRKKKDVTGLYVKKSTATEWLEENPEDLDALIDLVADSGLDGFGILTELPEVMKQRIAKALNESFSEDYWDNISETTGQQAERILEEGLQNGASIRDMADEMKEYLGGDEYAGVRARNIARTESCYSLNKARVDSIDQLEEDMEGKVPMQRVWMSVLGTTTRDSHADLDGVPADEENEWDLDGVKCSCPGDPRLPPENRINCHCVSADTEVEPIGSLFAATRMYYDGPIVELVTASGAHLKVTPNHPIATPGGWIRACELKAGDYVFRKVGVGLSAKDEQNKPTLIEDLFESIRSISSVVERTRPLPFQFHGDAEFGQGEIETAVSDIMLTDPISTERLQNGEKCKFMFAASKLHGTTDFGSMIGRGVLPPDILGLGVCSEKPIFVQESLNRGPGNPQSFRNFDLTPSISIRGKSGVLVERDTELEIGPAFFGFGCSTDMNICGSQSAANGPSIAIENHTYLCGGFSVGVQLDDLVNVEGNSFADLGSADHGLGQVSSADSQSFKSLQNGMGVAVEDLGDFGGTLSIAVELDQLVSVNIDSVWHGFVYDLQTGSGLYSASTIIIHNCTVITEFGMDDDAAKQEIEDYYQRQEDRWAGGYDEVAGEASMNNLIEKLASLIPESDDPLYLKCVVDGLKEGRTKRADKRERT